MLPIWIIASYPEMQYDSMPINLHALFNFIVASDVFSSQYQMTTSWGPLSLSRTGREQISAENPVSANSMGRLILQPTGDGESNMILMSQAVVATMYLDKTNQWETVGLQKRDEALKHISTGKLLLLIQVLDWGARFN